MDRDPFEFFKEYHAVYLHFSDSKYSYYKYHGKTKVTAEAFKNRDDKYVFYKAVKEFDCYDDFTYYCAWAFFSQPKVYPKNILEFHEGFKNWQIWHMDRLGNFLKDTETFLSVEVRKDLYECYSREEIHIGTLIIYDRLKPMFDVWNKEKQGDFLWDEFYKKIKKFLPFYYVYEPINVEFYKAQGNKFLQLTKPSLE